VLGQARQHVHAEAQQATRHARLGLTRLLDLLENVLKLIADERRDDRRRRFVGAESMVVAGVRDGGTHQILVSR